MEQTGIKLSNVSLEEINKMKMAELRQLCKAEGLKIGGPKNELQQRLRIRKTGRSDRYVGQETRCAICGERIKVTCTISTVMDDGRTLITRTVRCSGKNKHTYPLKEIVEPEKNQ